MSRIVEIVQQLRNIYLRDKKPWIVCFSGGKDSTALLQLVYYALQMVSQNERKKPVHVLCTDTLVEAPVVIEYVNKTLKLIEAAARRDSLPLTVTKLVPPVQDRFFVKIIGRGYPAPNRWFRWCTDRMKIKPANRFIKQQIAESGKVLILLGVRHDESATRSGSIHRFSKQNGFSRHATLKNALVYAPIKNLTTHDVWFYLVQSPSPWNGNNRKLVQLYKDASGGECPIVLDRSSPTCGGSRFGCWTCTVVKEDKSMEGFIESGQDWMEPLLLFRNWLGQVRNDLRLRARKRRNGKPGPGPFTLRAREIIFRRLARTEAEVGLPLIGEEEKTEIERLWRLDGYRGPSLLQVEAEEKQKWASERAKENKLGESFVALGGFLRQSQEEQTKILQATWQLRPT
jgi:DNA sulfur modification protein DndC